MDYAASLRQQAKWIDEAVAQTVAAEDRIELQDIDTDELRGAADEIERLIAALKPFAEPHAMGDNYVRFAPRLIDAARKALGI